MSAGFAIILHRGVPVPDLLLERITSLGESAEKSLLALLDRTDLPEETEMTVVSLLREMESQAPMQRYIDFIASLEEPSDKGDLCAEALLSPWAKRSLRPVLAGAFRGRAGRTGYFR